MNISTERKAFATMAGITLCCLAVILLLHATVAAADTVCAEVKLEIVQELTLERQAFDAHMRINNGLANITLEDVSVEVSFSDGNGDAVIASSDPENDDALFFINIDTMEGIGDVNGEGLVAPASSADIHWLIVPSPGAADGIEGGALYYVGAALTYNIGGESHTMEVTPDHIRVKPMPDILLEYFLPEEVFGDDAFTPGVAEPPVPFALGLRASNQGAGAVSDLKIESAQPKIVDNEQGLLVGFTIEESRVNGQSVEDTLLVNLGDIAPGETAVARWIMHCTLSGRFTSLEADLFHADKLGGTLTSLVQDPVSHVLVRDVLVDLSGRDGIRDFLTLDDSSYRIYESQGGDQEVIDRSADVQFRYLGMGADGEKYTLTLPETTGFVFAKLDDPYLGERSKVTAMRDDGKIIKPENIWLSKSRNGTGWNYHVCLFDGHPTTAYTLIFGESESGMSPEFIPVEGLVGREGELLSFSVSIKDSNRYPPGDLPVLTAAPLPAGAVFSDRGDGTADFTWTPSVGQAGTYEIEISAGYHGRKTGMAVSITVIGQEDSDGDGMADDWEIFYFGTLERDGTGDFDGDGISDLDEFLFGSDPGVVEHAPSSPVISAPLFGEKVDTLIPTLFIENSIDMDGDVLTYQFELTDDAAFNQSVAVSLRVGETTPATFWAVGETLEENKQYFWRVRAFDGVAYSLWTYGEFRVDTENDAPGSFPLTSPSDGSQVTGLNPVLEVANSHDPDGDELTYTFLVFDDAGLTSLYASVSGITEDPDGTTSWTVTPALTDHATYYWKVVAEDGNGHRAESAAALFATNSASASPAMPEITAPAQNAEIESQDVDLIVANSLEPDGEPVTYFFETDSSPAFDSQALQTSGAVSEGTETTSWHVSGLSENTRYFWRVKASDGSAESPWATGSFFVNADNQAPPAPVVKNPGNGAWVGSRIPSFTVHPVSEPDHDRVSYRFVIYSDAGLTQEIADGLVDAVRFTMTFELSDNTRYWWRVRAEDEHGMPGEWSAAAEFFIKTDGAENPPQIEFWVPAVMTQTNEDTLSVQWTTVHASAETTLSLYYDSDDSSFDGTPMVEDLFGDSGTYDWDISALEGTFYIYAVIVNDSGRSAVYAPGAVRIDRTPPAVSAAPAGGEYDGPVSVVLSADEPAEIRYTLDGTDPTADAQVFDAPLLLTATTVLKFVANDGAGNASGITAESYIIGSASSIFVHVATDGGRPLAGLKVYAFTQADSYTGIAATTNSEGVAEFGSTELADGDYHFRADYMQYQFWTELVAIPGTGNVSLAIEEEHAEVLVTTAEGPVPDVKVYLFSESGSYLGVYSVTDTNGNAAFDLPAGRAFKFRADILGNRFWSATATISDGSGNTIPLSSGGGKLRLSVLDELLSPLSGVKVYLFSQAGSYLGLIQTPDSSGTVEFSVPEGTYRARADLLGNQFWSAETLVNEDMEENLVVSHADVTVSVRSVFLGTVEPMAGIKVYLFTPAGSYLNVNETTDSNGNSVFRVPATVPYKVRADFLGQQFWTVTFTGEDAVVEISAAVAAITVTGGGQPLAGIPVYVFSSGGSYLGVNGSSDADGRVDFRLPAGDYTFRVDYQGSQFWSGDQHLSADVENEIGISSGGGMFTLTVLSDATAPLAGATCYLFSETGSYLGLSEVTSSQGQVSFNVSDGVYQIRVDHMGYSFWTEFYTVPDTLAEVFTIPHADVAVSVRSIYQETSEPLENIKVYLFTPAGSYLNVNETTDSNGNSVFRVPATVPYKVRADFLGQQFWTVPFTGEDAVVEISAAVAAITVTGGGQPLAGIPVYVFSSGGSYLGVNGSSDADGRVDFRLPAGDYTFRADYQASRYWSGNQALAADVENNIGISTGGGMFTLTVLSDATAPLTGATCYLFSETGSYLGLSEVTSSQGQVSFNVSDGVYQIRVDHMGYSFWTEFYTVPDTLAEVFTIPHADVTVSVRSIYQETSEPLENIKVYLFTPAGSYLGLKKTTDASGNAVFNLPDAAYIIRADYLGQSFWSAEIQSSNIEIPVDHGVAEILAVRSGTSLPGAKVYLFSENGAYLGLVKTTDEAGSVSYLLPDRIFQFRVDEGADQAFSPLIEISADQTEVAEVNLD